MAHTADSNNSRPSTGERAVSDRARVLLEINNAIVTQLDLAQVLNAISACLRREIKHDFAALALYDAEVNQLRLHALDFPADQDFLKKGQLIPLTGTPAALAFSTRKPVLRHRPAPEEFPNELMKRAYEHGIRSGCAVPLLCHDKIVGSMAIASLKESAFNEDDLELLTQIGVQAAIAVENAMNFQKARAAQEQSRLLLEINNAVVSHLDLKELLKFISTSLHQIVPHDLAFVALLDSSGTQLRVHAYDLQAPSQGFRPPAEGITVSLDETPEGAAIRTRRPVFIKDRAAMDGFSPDLAQKAAEYGIKSGCTVPLIVHGHVLGTVSMVSFREQAFTEADAKLLEQCSTQVAIAVQNSINFEAAREAERVSARERDRSHLMLEINNAVVSHLDLKELLKSISASLHRLVPHDMAFVTLLDPTGTQLRVQALDVHTTREGRPPEEGITVSVIGTPEGEAIRSRKPVLIAGPPDLERISSDLARKCAEYGIKSGCAVPLIAHGHTLGAVSMIGFREGAFSEEDAILLEQCSGQIAIAVQNALNFENAREAEKHATRERDRSQLLLEINNALVSHLDLRQLVSAVSHSLNQVIQHDFVGLAIFDSESGNFFAQAADSALKPMSDGIFYDPEGTVGGLCFKTRQPVYAPRPDPEKFPSPVTKKFYERGLKTLYAVPLVVHGRLLGVMSISSSREDALTAEDRELFQSIGSQVAIAAANALAVRDLEALKDKLAQEKLYLEDEIRTEFNFDEIVGHSPTIREVLRLVQTVAPSDSTVLLLGETGTGKELIARAVHEHSRRKSRTFVKLNCAAIPTGLLESELFGHEKGAFTGAIAQKIGRLELADQGTLFLDEVGDIPVDIQPKLLRALQEREFERLGSIHTKKVNVRLVAATNRNLEKMIEDREFRSDLYYRLNVFPIRIPPLRERPGDIPLLVRYFAEKFARQMQKSIDSISASAMAKLQAWHWPGNVRELENLIERSVILSNGSALQVSLPEVERASPKVVVVSQPSDTLESTDRDQIIKVLRETRGILAGPNGAATRLGLKRTTLQYKIKKLGITRDQWWPMSSA